LRSGNDLAYSFHGEGLLIDGFATTIVSGFPRLFYPYQGVLEQPQYRADRKGIKHYKTNL
jgi:hypothetical protein